MSGITADQGRNNHNSNRPMTSSNRNHTSPNLLEYGFPSSATGVPPPPLPPSRKTSGGTRFNLPPASSNTNTNPSSPSKTSQKKGNAPAAVIAVEDDDEDDVIFPMQQQQQQHLASSLSHNNLDDFIPGPPLGSLAIARTEKSTSRSRGNLIHRVLHPGQSSHGAAIRSRTPSVDNDVLQLSQLSNTEHHWAGAGILASRQDLEMVSEYGCE
jgi:hypothetical protein